MIVAPAVPAVRPRPVFCAIEHLHRARVVADEVAAGRFSLCGITLELGLEPDWLGASLPVDEEWRIEWSKFYFGLDLACAFRDTGDPAYLEAWEALVGSWIHQVPVGFDTSDVAARRMQNWLYAWQLFAATPGFPGLRDGLASELTRSLAEQAAFVREHLTPERNHRTLELYALFLLPLALPELDPDGDFLSFATAALCDDLRQAFREDGVHREASTHYHLIVLRSFLGARENARRFGVALAGDYDVLLERACEFAVHAHRPDGGIPALSDSDGGSYADVLKLAGTLLGRTDLLYVASGGRVGTPPARLSASFPVGGYFVQRSGWGDARTAFAHERFLVFDCGPLGDGGHGHYDLLSVEIAGAGRPLVVDPGRFTYAELEENLRRWFKGTAAHNTVTVDGLDQTPYRRGKPKGPVAQGRFLGRLQASGLDVIVGEARSPAYEAVHRRRVAFVAGEYWVIEDRLRGQLPHRYDLRFHLAPEAWEKTAVEGQAVRAPGLALVLAPPARPLLEPGWVSVEYGVRLAAPVVSAAIEGAAEAVFVTLVVPVSADAPCPMLEVRDQPDGGILVEATGQGPAGRFSDLIVLGDEAVTLERLERRP